MARELMYAEQNAKTAPRRPTADPLAALAEEAREAQLREARAVLEGYDDELTRTNEQATTAFARLTALRHLEASCRQWAAEHGIVLPGEATGPGRAMVQPSQGGRQFNPTVNHPAAAPPVPPQPTPGIDARGAFGRLRSVWQ